MKKLLAQPLALLLPLFALTACDTGWPPRKDDMIEHFEKHRSGIEQLAREFSETDYIRMSIGLPGQAHADFQGEEYMESVRLEDDEGERWHQLLIEAGVNSIFDGEDYTAFEINIDYGDGSGGITQFVHAPNQERMLKECKDEFRDLGCGWCAVHLDTDWYVSSGWWQYEPDKEALAAYMDDEISWDEYEVLQDKASDACEAEGRAIIGYPPASDEDQ